MRLVNDQMRSLSSHVVLAANHDGTLKLALADDDVIGSAYWTRLEHPNVQGDMEQDLLAESSRKKFHEVHMHTKALQGVLSCSMLAKSTVACFCSGYCVVFYVYLAGQSRQTRPMQRTGNNDRGVLNVRITLLNSGGSNRVSQFVVAGLAHDE
jgi:checkpoint protein hus1